MSTKGAPPIPPRPTRSPNNAPTSNANPPKIPPRPTSRPDRSSPPKLDNPSPSPLNAPPASGLLSADSPIDHSFRPDNGILSSIEQKHVEDDNSGSLDAKVAGDGVEQPAETRNVHHDLHLHAPRPSLPTSSATAQVQAVTRTDASHGHETGSEEDVSRRSLHSKADVPHIQLELSSASADRKSFANDEETGIPEIGQRVPMYPNAGDVQAPSPSPGPTSSRGNNSQKDGHGRTRSRQEASIPPGSYGLHGHGVTPDDPFEKSWYQKHPQELAHEEKVLHGSGVGSPRPEWAMSTDDLNKIVKSSISKGTSNDSVCTPDEEIGNIMAEELASRFKSPPAESPLQNEVSSEQPTAKSLSESQKLVDAAKEAREDKDEHHGVKIHIDEPLHHQHHPDGFAPAPDFNDANRDGIHDDEEEDVPVLASDEVDPNSVGLQPAVSPPLEHRKNDSFGHEAESSRRKQPIRSTSATSKASNKQTEGQEGEDVAEPTEHVRKYEPLFPDDDNKDRLSPEQRFKSPTSQTQRFPSKDIWEDAPSSAQLHATVSTPDIPRRPKRGESESESVFETPEQEQERVREADKLKVQSGLEETPGTSDDLKSQEHDPNQRFPSRDIWEEAPESQQLTTSVEIPEKPEKPEKPSLPSLPPRPQRQEGRSSEEQPSVSPTKSQPVSPTELKKRPSIPDRPKPQIPQRPTRKKSHDSGETLTKTISGGSTDEAARPVPKAKPAVPPRAVGSKIAALKAGFLSDLDNRLKLGPQAPKPKEKEKEDAESAVERGPLSDARKGRAKGPPRRKPAVSKPAVVEKTEKPQTPEIKLADPWNVWSIGPNGEVNVPSEQPSKTPSEPSDVQSESPRDPPPTKVTASPPNNLESLESEASTKATDATVIPRDEDKRDDQVSSEEVPPLPSSAEDKPTTSLMQPSEPQVPDIKELEEDDAKLQSCSGLKAAEAAPNAAGITDKEATVGEPGVPVAEAKEILPLAEEEPIPHPLESSEMPSSKIESKAEAEAPSNSEKQ
ncbi:uncharacterized protein GIQ15_01067 [Arthroderma uncinatum]|uniref:uncharacterized protein n=1 Tax=Arthroderma uncinatum TaxID=74035 RepID=UPI00144A9913|nr:uncharacterized protein GIQ15_01067 [Arthroderma uncinatum]KAF3491550.1 hypothetical protein GIQ15_01067 [Arthroderma uncinatum]